VVDLHPDALDELRKAARWYDSRRAGLGDELVESVSVCFLRLADDADAFPVWPGTPETSPPIRRALVETFPYAIAFEVHPDRVFVLAIAHAKRRPLYWLQRSDAKRRLTRR
jgi:toxin ParE1/3/4